MHAHQLECGVSAADHRFSMLNMQINIITTNFPHFKTEELQLL